MSLSSPHRWFRRMLMAGAVAGASLLTLGSAAGPAQAQGYNPYCYAPYYNAYYCQYYGA